MVSQLDKSIIVQEFGCGVRHQLMIDTQYSTFPGMRTVQYMFVLKLLSKFDLSNLSQYNKPVLQTHLTRSKLLLVRELLS